MGQVTNYTSGMNRKAKARTQRWVVTAIYRDPALDTTYPYRSETGARKQYEYLLRLVEHDRTRNLGSGRNAEIPLVGATIEQLSDQWPDNMPANPPAKLIAAYEAEVK